MDFFSSKKRISETLRFYNGMALPLKSRKSFWNFGNLRNHDVSETRVSPAGLIEANTVVRVRTSVCMDMLQASWKAGGGVLIGQIIEPCNFRYLNEVEKLFRDKQSVKFKNFNFNLYKFNSGFRKMVMSMLFTISLLLKCFRTITFLHSEVDNYFVGIFHLLK